VTLSRLGRRTDELANLLTDRLRETRGRTAAFLGSLLPGLDPAGPPAGSAGFRSGGSAP
jgi:hypothetical protein